jgi:hypothetical protein
VLVAVVRQTGFMAVKEVVVVLVIKTITQLLEVLPIPLWWVQEVLQRPPEAILTL